MICESILPESEEEEMAPAVVVLRGKIKDDGDEVLDVENTNGLNMKVGDGIGLLLLGLFAARTILLGDLETFSLDGAATIFLSLCGGSEAIGLSFLASTALCVGGAEALEFGTLVIVEGHEVEGGRRNAARGTTR
jgi:hypothetical protein